MVQLTSLSMVLVAKGQFQTPNAHTTTRTILADLQNTHMPSHTANQIVAALICSFINIIITSKYMTESGKMTTFIGIEG